MSIRILQLSDPHLLSHPEGRIRGVPTFQTFCQVLQYVEDEEISFHWMVMTGDLAHDGKRQTYQLLRSVLEDQFPQCCLLPGNHESPALLCEVFPEVKMARRSFVSFSVKVAGWKLVGLDSHSPGTDVGRLGCEQLDWLRKELEAEPQIPTVLFLHHHPVPIKCSWLDRIGLEDAESLAKVIFSAPQVRVICCGHVHQEFQGRLGNAAVLSAPSTAFQFVPRTENPVLDPVLPGFRILDLEKQNWTTQVVRLPVATDRPGQAL